MRPQPAAARTAPLPPPAQDGGRRPPSRTAGATAFFEGLPAEQRQALRSGLEATLERGQEQFSASPPPSTPPAPLRHGLGPEVPPPMNFVEGLSAEQRQALMAKLGAGLPGDLDMVRAGAEQHLSTVEASGRGPARTRIQCRDVHEPVCSAHEPPCPIGPGTAVSLPLKLIGKLPAEQRQVLMAKLQVGLPRDMDKLREALTLDPSTVAETSEEGPEQATVQNWPQTTRGPTLGVHEPPYPTGPGAAVPLPLKFIKKLSAEQRRLLMATLEVGLPRDMARLRDRARRHPPGAAEMPEEGPAWAKVPDRPQATRGPAPTARGPPCTAGPPPSLKFLEGLSAEQRRALTARLEAGLPADVERLGTSPPPRAQLRRAPCGQR
ncbi:unnamed protein product [Prorocentrum cordatum]|uniref:Uncharacterized protein n=1 Tax=Prorocentrum cordatum TaxID=2364126 RepID=A0ABN9WER2_9DINO|nr:unnamed protein product [Polarella glacialis]